MNSLHAYVFEHTGVQNMPRKKEVVIVPDQLAYSPAQCAKVVGISLSLLYQEWRNNRGPAYFHINKRRLISRDSAAEYVKQRSQS